MKCLYILCSGLIFFSLAAWCNTSVATAQGRTETPESSTASQDDAKNEALELYKKKLLPILKRDCFECHSKSEDRFESGLDVETRQGLIDGGDRGTAFDFDDVEESLLLIALSYEDEELQMPPNGRLSDKEIGYFKQWIKQGAPMPENK